MGRDILYISYRSNVRWVQIVCITSALPETTGNFATMYNWNENMQFHANVFANFLKVQSITTRAKICYVN